MSTIPVSTDVQVNITTKTQFPSFASFGIGNVIGVLGTIPTSERIRFYSNITAVADDFPSTTEEWKAANSYFSQSPTPSNGIYISRWVNANTNAELRTGISNTVDVSQWSLVTNGSFRVNINGTLANVIALDFSAIVTLADVAAVIQAGLITAGFTGATCVFSLSQGVFIIQSGTSGSSSTISFLITATASVGTDISGNASGLPYLNGQTGGSAIISQGLNSETIGEGLDAIQEENDNWYGFGYTNVVRDDANVIAAATWAQSKILIYFTATNDPVTLTTGTSDISYQLMQLGFTRTIPFYHMNAILYPEFAFMGNGFTRDVGSATWKFKVMNGITPSDEVTSNQLANLEGKNCNIFITIGNIAYTREGVVSSGEFIDIVRGVDWLQNQIQINVQGLLFSENLVPYTDTGVTQLAQTVQSALDLAEEQGFIAARTDANDVLQPAYTITTIRVALVPPSQRAARIAPTITFIAYLAGAIHFVTISGTVQI